MEAAEGGPRGAALVARERLPVGRVDVLVRGSGRTPRGDALAVRERLPDGRNDVRFCGGGQALRGATLASK